MKFIPSRSYLRTFIKDRKEVALDYLKQTIYGKWSKWGTVTIYEVLEKRRFVRMKA